jgi:hypothetical protein
VISGHGDSGSADPPASMVVAFGRWRFFFALLANVFDDTNTTTSTTSSFFITISESCCPKLSPRNRCAGSRADKDHAAPGMQRVATSMSLIALLLMTHGTLAAITAQAPVAVGLVGSPSSAPRGAPVTPTPVAPTDVSPPGYVPPPAYPPPPPVLYGPPPVYLQPVYGPPPLRVRVYPALGSAAPADLAPLRSQPFTHDGFYFHADVGGGITSASRDNGGGDRVTVLGGSASISVAVGWSVARNLALFGELAVSGMDTPDVKVNGVAMNTAGTNSTFGGFAAGAAYFIEPLNVYLSAALGTMAFQLVDSNDQPIYRTNWGLGFQAMAGKEWWVGPEVGAGIAAEVKAAWLTDSGADRQPWSAAAYSLVFSITYN